MSVYDNVLKDKKHRFYHLVLADKQGELFKDRPRLEKARGEETFRDYLHFRATHGFPAYEMEFADAEKIGLPLCYAHGIDWKDSKWVFNPPDGKSWSNSSIQLKIVTRMNNEGAFIGGVVIGKNRNGSYVDADRSVSGYMMAHGYRAGLIESDDETPREEPVLVTAGQIAAYAVLSKEMEAAKETLTVARANAAAPIMKFETLVRTAEHIGGDRKRAEEYVRAAVAPDTRKAVGVYDQATGVVAAAESLLRQKESELRQFAPKKSPVLETDTALLALSMPPPKMAQAGA